jgi:hypothetical protein
MLEYDDSFWADTKDYLDSFSCLKSSSHYAMIDIQYNNLQDLRKRCLNIRPPDSFGSDNGYYDEHNKIVRSFHLEWNNFYHYLCSGGSPIPGFYPGHKLKELRYINIYFLPNGKYEIKMKMSDSWELENRICDDIGSDIINLLENFPLYKSKLKKLV